MHLVREVFTVCCSPFKADSARRRRPLDHGHMTSWCSCNQHVCSLWLTVISVTQLSLFLPLQTSFCLCLYRPSHWDSQERADLDQHVQRTIKETAKQSNSCVRITGSYTHFSLCPNPQLRWAALISSVWRTAQWSCFMVLDASVATFQLLNGWNNFVDDICALVCRLSSLSLTAANSWTC